MSKLRIATGRLTWGDHQLLWMLSAGSPAGYAQISVDGHYAVVGSFSEASRYQDHKKINKCFCKIDRINYFVSFYLIKLVIQLQIYCIINTKAAFIFILLHLNTKLVKYILLALEKAMLKVW